jgi:dihydroxyacid dehydratase/phosphogluconate dehydratase
VNTDPRSRSRVLVDGPDRAGARAFFKAVGFGDADLAKPLVGVAHCWIEVTPCNANHRVLAEKVKEGILQQGYRRRAPVGRHGEVRALRVLSVPGRGHRVDA